MELGKQTRSPKGACSHEDERGGSGSAVSLGCNRALLPPMLDSLQGAGSKRVLLEPPPVLDSSPPPPQAPPPPQEPKLRRRRRRKRALLEPPPVLDSQNGGSPDDDLLQNMSLTARLFRLAAQADSAGRQLRSGCQAAFRHCLEDSPAPSLEAAVFRCCCWKVCWAV